MVKTDNQEFNDQELQDNPTTGNESPAPGSDNLSVDGDTAGDNPAEGTANGNEIAEWKDKYMRLSAEFDNYRKRTLKEKMDLVSYGGEEVIKALLPVLDDIDRALDVMHTTEDVKSVRSGIELITHKLRETLKQKGVAEIEALGQELDTDFHEAVAKIPAPDKKSKGKILDVVQKGYQLKDKVLRHCKVVVGE